MILFGLIPLASFILLYRIALRVLGPAGDRREAFIVASVIWGSLVTLGTEALNLGHNVSFAYVLGFWVLVFIAAVIFSLKHPPPKAAAISFSALSRIELVMILTCVVIVVLVGMVAFMAAPNSWDAVNYHMSRVMFWKQNHSVDHYPTPEFRQLLFQPWTGYALLHFQILTESDRMATLVSWFSFAGSIVGVSFITALLGGTKTAQILSALIAATIPTAIVEASGVRIDMIVTFWLVCFVGLLLLLDRKGGLSYVIFIGTSIGLAALTKGTSLLILPIFVCWFILILFKQFRWSKIIQSLAMVAFIVITFNAGFFYRNYAMTGDPLGPAAMRHWGLTYDMNARLCLSNVVRTISFQLGSGLPAWDNLVVGAVTSLHRWLDIDMKDQRSTISTAPFYISVSTHEDGVTNFLQTILILLSFSFLLVNALRQKRADLVFYMAAVTMAFIVLTCSIRWTNHITRYCLPLLTLSAVIIAFFIESLGRKRFIAGMIILALAATAMPYVFKNNLRRLAFTRKQTVFNTPRVEQYFRNDRSLLEPYTQAVEEVVDRQCGQIGLYMGFNTWDYPLGVIINQKFHHHYRIEHVKVNLYSPSGYPLGPFRPCALIGVYTNDPVIELGGNQKFKKVKDFRETAVYIPMEGPTYKGPVVPVKFSALD